MGLFMVLLKDFIDMPFRFGNVFLDGTLGTVVPFLTTLVADEVIFLLGKTGGSGSIIIAGIGPWLVLVLLGLPVFGIKLVAGQDVSSSANSFGVVVIAHGKVCCKFVLQCAVLVLVSTDNQKVGTPFSTGI